MAPAGSHGTHAHPWNFRILRNPCEFIGGGAWGDGPLPARRPRKSPSAIRRESIKNYGTPVRLETMDYTYKIKRASIKHRTEIYREPIEIHASALNLCESTELMEIHCSHGDPWSLWESLEPAETL